MAIFWTSYVLAIYVLYPAGTYVSYYLYVIMPLIITSYK